MKGMESLVLVSRIHLQLLTVRENHREGKKKKAHAPCGASEEVAEYWD